MIVILGLCFILLGVALVVCGVFRGHYDEKRSALTEIEYVSLDDERITVV